MANSATTGRLSFLYPVVFSPRLTGRNALRRSHAPLSGMRTCSQSRRRIHGSARVYRPAGTPNVSTGPRYGSANEPLPNIIGESKAARQEGQAQGEKRAQNAKETASSGKGEEREASTKDTSKSDTGTTAAREDASKSTSSGDSIDTRMLTSLLNLNSVLAQDSEDAPEEKPPQLRPPPYEHHFDTHSIMQNLKAGGFTEEQAIDMMKVTRGLLTANMMLARDALLSKGEAEMQQYRFRARCAEMRTEIKNARNTSSEAQRSQRNMLQHEVDVLSQRITAETQALKDELKGMFDDRKMAVRQERQDVANRVQEVNYQITTEMNSEIKSEVEGLRWILVRRAALTLFMVSLMILTALRYAKHLEDVAEQNQKRQAELARGNEGNSLRVRDGESPSFESLG